MARNERTVRLITSDRRLFDKLAERLAGLAGWRVAGPLGLESALVEPSGFDDVLLLDVAAPGGNPYEAIRRLTSPNHRRLYLLVPDENPLAEPIARFCGATGVLRADLNAEDLRRELEAFDQVAARPDLEGDPRPILPEALLRELEAESTRPTSLIESLADPETSLFNYDFLTYKLDEELKRARRFHLPLSVVMAGFDGQAGDEVLRQLSGLFLQASRDTDLLGRFDISSFLFLLPHTPPAGAETMARRVQSAVEELGLKDLVGDPLVLSVGIASFPHPDVARSADLYRLAREAYLAAEGAGGGVLFAR